MDQVLKYLSAYPLTLQQQIQSLIDEQRLAPYLLSKYPKKHDVSSDKSLREYVMSVKSRYMKKSRPVNHVQYDHKLHVIKNALGMNSFLTKAHGGKLKTKNSIRISSLFQTAPEEFLNMIVVHELAHLKEKEHNKAFYQLCSHMQPDYYQLEFDTRVYLTELELNGPIYS